MASVLPSLSRRLFLRGAAVAAPLAVVPALAAAAEAYAEENPALLALEPELVAAEAEMIASSIAYDEAYRIGMELWPRAPEEITRPHGGGDNLERDIAGAAYEGGRGFMLVEWLRDDVKTSKRWRRITPERQEFRRCWAELLAISEKYEADRNHAKAVSGFPAAVERREAAAEGLSDCLQRIHAEEARTMAGVRIKAKAFRAWEHAPRVYRFFNAHGADWSKSFARAVLDIMEG